MKERKGDQITKKLGATVSISKEKLLTQYPGMEFRTFEDAMTDCIKLAARPLRSSVLTRGSYCVSQVEEFKVPWANHWWMKFLQWLGTKIESKVLNWISDAVTYRTVFRTERMPEGIYERIVIQLNELRACGKKPRMALLGGDGTLCKLWSNSDFERFATFSSDIWADRIFGLEIKVSPFLAEGEVLVV